MPCFLRPRFSFIESDKSSAAMLVPICDEICYILRSASCAHFINYDEYGAPLLVLTFVLINCDRYSAVLPLPSLLDGRSYIWCSASCAHFLDKYDEFGAFASRSLFLINYVKY